MLLLAPCLLAQPPLGLLSEYNEAFFPHCESLLVPALTQATLCKLFTFWSSVKSERLESGAAKNCCWLDEKKKKYCLEIGFFTSLSGKEKSAARKILRQIKAFIFLAVNTLKSNISLFQMFLFALQRA